MQFTHHSSRFTYREDVIVFVKTVFAFFSLSLILWLFIVSQIQLFTYSSAEDTPSDKGTTPTYVGVAVCSKCHVNKELGNQYEAWLVTKHARSWVMLQSSNAKKVAENAGVKNAPQKSIQCLKCHAPATTVDKSDSSLYQRGARGDLESTFHIEDGVQCEVCHGPASQYVAMKMDKETTVKVQLKRLTKEDCMICHNEKPSHEILKGKKFDYEKGWNKITHPLPTEGKK
jgi:hypothetical protein